MGLSSHILDLVLAKPSVSFVPLLLFQDKSFTSKRLKVSKIKSVWQQDVVLFIVYESFLYAYSSRDQNKFTFLRSLVVPILQNKRNPSLKHVSWITKKTYSHVLYAGKEFEWNITIMNAFVSVVKKAKGHYAALQKNNF